jgi:hypothetical protein
MIVWQQYLTKYTAHTAAYVLPVELALLAFELSAYWLLATTLYTILDSVTLTLLALQNTYVKQCFNSDWCAIHAINRYSEIPRLEALVAQADAEEQQQTLQLTATSSDNGTEEEVADVIRKGPMLGDTVTEHHVSSYTSLDTVGYLT